MCRATTIAMSSGTMATNSLSGTMASRLMKCDNFSLKFLHPQVEFVLMRQALDAKSGGRFLSTG
jgi:hypothetical protein